MYFCLAASIAIAVAYELLLNQPNRPFGMFLVSLALLLWLVITLLVWRGKLARLKQTLTALFGTDTLLTTMSLPLAAYRFPSTTDPTAWGGLDLTLSFVQLGLWLWSLLVLSHILRHALELPLALTNLIVIVWLVLLFMVAGMIIGPTAAAAPAAG